MQRLTLIIFSILAKTLAFFSKLLGKGSGTALPGLIVEKYFKPIIGFMGNDFEEVIMLSGTNGKTTSRAILVHVFESQGQKICTNRGGANIFRGIASSLLLNLNLFGKPMAKTLILEVEEATLPILTKFIKPDKLILTNIFRDQLDAYGEIDKTLSFFTETLEQSSPEVIINFDDKKLLESLPKNYDKSKIYGFTLQVADEFKPNFEKSEKSGTTKKTSEIVGINWQEDLLDQEFEIQFKESKESHKIQTQLSGVYNLYNILPVSKIIKDRFGAEALDEIKNFKPVFGRGENFILNGKKVIIMLVKNPAGFSQVLDLIDRNIQKISKKYEIVTLINDNIADGKDVSWLWDVNFEKFIKNNPNIKIQTGGKRSLDMLLRWETAGAKVNLKNNFEDLEKVKEHIYDSKNEILLLCTYTALLQIRNKLAKVADLKDLAESGN